MNELLNQTISCKTCKGTGEVGSVSGFAPGGIDPEDSRTPCPDCAGCGANFDNVIPDIIKEFIPREKLYQVSKIVEKIYEHIDKKLIDSYERGVRDGVYAAKKEEEETAKLENKEGEDETKKPV